MLQLSQHLEYKSGEVRQKAGEKRCSIEEKVNVPDPRRKGGLDKYKKPSKGHRIDMVMRVEKNGFYLTELL